jgi:hypothetical protein
LARRIPAASAGFQIFSSFSRFLYSSEIDESVRLAGLVDYRQPKSSSSVQIKVFFTS